MLYKKTKNQQEGKPKDINCFKGVIRKGSVSYMIMNTLKEPMSAKQVSELLGIDTYSVHQVCRKHPHFNGVKQVNPITGRWETYYSVINKTEPHTFITEKLIKFLSKKPDMMYPAVYLAKKLNVSHSSVYRTLRTLNNVEITTEKEGKFKVNYYSIKS